MADFDQLKKPDYLGVLAHSNGAAAMSAEGLGPKIGGGEPASPWAALANPAPAPAPPPTYLQQPAAMQQPAAPAHGLSPQEMAIEGAAQAIASGVPPWALQMLYGGYT
jgi:hypothetical protein